MADIKVSQLNDGVVDSSSYLLESNTGVSYKVKASDIGTFVNASQADYLLNTTANTIVGAINENVAYDNTASGLLATTKQGAIDELGTIETYTPTSNYGTFVFSRVGKLKMLQFTTLQNLASEASTTIDFTLPNSFKPSTAISYDARIPSTNDTVRINLNADGSVDIYNYTTITGTINSIGCVTYI